MSIETDEDALVRESFERLRADFDQFSIFFYEALFRRAPELRDLFRGDLSGQGMKFMATLREILKAREAGEASGRLKELGTYHANLGITAESFEPMEEALIDTLRYHLRDAVTPELEAAWRKAYADIASKMIRDGGMT